MGLSVTFALGACAAPAPGGFPADAVGSSLVPGSTSAGSSVAVGVSSTTGSDRPVPTASGPSASGPSASGPVTSGAGVVATPLPDCTPAVLKSVTPGKIIFTTGENTVAPWFIDGNPADGKGFEAAVVGAVATELGYRAADVRWTRSDLTKVIAGQGGGFDVAVGEFATPEQTGGPVDYSTGYFSISTSVVARTGTPAAAVNRLTGLTTLRLGSVPATVGSTDRGGRITPARTPTAYGTAAAALAALRSGAVDAVLLPTPAAIAAGSSVTIIGQLDDPTEQPSQFGMVLPKNSPLTPCVSAAIDQLRVTGTLAALVKTWVPSAAKPLR